ncbi:PAS domain-containing protein [Sansalvadorimonas sp. 2012CJ34-2]|uniref:PAS domain-containing protein n=1 Tax=Parendozoicomonas callyspongiae TaxID=2942213 RepID=A0ABT0PG03_9GAMM|nr:PAS domain-containing protein [Sansalvadorimonas sp. 2012CJ34-2]MCL6270304.1 PAS domain-containing protein [Sansalvadorimonas sp. 2012CJ34-2]
MDTASQDKNLEALKPYFIIVDFVADFIGPHCEVLLHSLDSVGSSVVHIVNGNLTNRKLGSPMTDLGVKQVAEMRKTGNLNTGPYFTHGRDGNLFKSISCGCTDSKGHLIGFLCINMNLNRPFPEIIKTLMPGLSDQDKVLNESFNNNMDDLLDTVTEEVINEVAADRSIPLKQKNRCVVHELYDRGIFQMKGAPQHIANKLNVTKHSVYKYYREVK